MLEKSVDPSQAARSCVDTDPKVGTPNPAFFYDIGGGPMLDMGPYYITALVNLLGPVKRVAAITTKGFEERIATSDALRGMRIPVHITTHLTGVLEFENGTIVTTIMSFDMWRQSLPCIEIYGETGSMTCPGSEWIWRPP